MLGFRGRHQLSFVLGATGGLYERQKIIGNFMDDKFKIDLRPYLNKAKKFTKRVALDNVIINLPFVSFVLSPTKQHKKSLQAYIICFDKFYEANSEKLNE